MLITLTILSCISFILLVVVLLAVRKSAGGASAASKERIDALAAGQERTERAVREEIARNREELTGGLKMFGDSFFRQNTELTRAVEQKLKDIQAVVDEKLHATLEKRLGESFKQVSERLEQVHRGLGEMQSLASGVGDLKKILANVKTRGGWGEIQLGNLLEQMLSSEQFERNVATKKGSADRVEFAVKLPGRDDGDGVVWLPIDAKFPLDCYQRLAEALERADPAAIEETSKLLETEIKKQAKSIREKYIDPPGTTDFALMFLPVEGLYAEVLRRTGLVETLQRDFRVVVAGPTTLTALLNSLQMGFRTLAIEKRSSEVWTLLRTVKTEFEKFGDLLEKTRKKLDEATTSIGDAVKKTRTIERRLRDVQELPATQAKGHCEESATADDEAISS